MNRVDQFILAVGALILLFASNVVTANVTRLVQQEEWEDRLTEAGLAHYDARTGEWVLNADAEDSE